jgi:ribulose-bisphosphate carboxylase small chain
MFELQDPNGAMERLEECRKTFPQHYIKLNGYDRTKGKQTTMLSFIVQRPEDEPGFVLERTEAQDRRIQYTIRPRSKSAN